MSWETKPRLPAELGVMAGPRRFVILSCALLFPPNLLCSIERRVPWLACREFTRCTAVLTVLCSAIVGHYSSGGHGNALTPHE